LRNRDRWWPERFAFEGEGGGEGGDVGEIEIGFEFGSVARELGIRWTKWIGSWAICASNCRAESRPWSRQTE